MSLTTKTVRLAEIGLDFDVFAEDAVIGPAIERGGWEEHETRLFRAHISPGDRVIDLGANVGWYGVQAVLAGADVHCFEPVPAIAEVCWRNLERAMRIGRGRATLHRCAAGSARSQVEIAVGNTNLGDNRVLDPSRGRPTDMDIGAVVSVPVERVDDLLSGPFRVIKIDTQGSEWHALTGMQEILERSTRCALFLEYWPHALRGVRGEEMLHYLTRLGYVLGKATAAPYPMTPARIQRQSAMRDPLRGGIDLYGVRGVPFHVGGIAGRVRSLARSIREG